MFRRYAHARTAIQTQAPAIVSVLWFIHDTPGITEKVPYTCETDMLNAIQKFFARYGADHDSEFLVIFCDNEYIKQKIQQVAKTVTGEEYAINATSAANKLF